MPNRLMRLLRDNAQARARLPFKAEASAEEATLYIYDVIVSDGFWGGVEAEEVVKELMSLSAPVIHIRINSPGGEVFAARAIEDAIRRHPSKCIAHVDGYAASAASIVATACDEVEIVPGGFFMIHRAWTLEAGNCEDFAKTSAWLAKVDDTLRDTYATDTGQKPDDIMRMMEDETWMNAQESIDLGFADRIAEAPAKTQASWNLSVYSKAPKHQPPSAQLQHEPAQQSNSDGPGDDNDSDNAREKFELLSRLHGTTRPDSRAV